jgi:hypothetical protein
VLRILNFLRIRRLSRADYITYDDVSNILERDWIRRLWTYQEILLASNPVVVCGDKHLQWSTFALGIVSLQYQVPHTETREILISSTKAWASVVDARARLHNSHPNSLDSSALWQRQPRHRQLATLRTYEEFLYRIYQIQGYYLLGSMFLSICMLVVIFLTGSLLISMLFWSVVAWSWIGEPFFLPAYILFAVSASYLLLWALRTPAEDLTFLTVFGGKGPLVKTQTYGLVDGVLSRKAQDPKDKAFAMWAVLQRLFTETLPTPDYSLSVGQIYKQLSIYLIHATGSLDMLLPAAQSSFPGQPSWVPDWSQDDYNFWRSPPLVGAFSNRRDHRHKNCQEQYE